MPFRSPIDPDRPARVLVVDDDPDFTGLVELWLEIAGLHGDLAHNAGDAVRCVEQSNIEVVCLDIDMPGDSGLIALERIRALRPSLPIIMMTAVTDANTVREAMAIGAFDFVSKPVDEQRLLTTIARALTHSRLAHQLASLERSASVHRGLGQLWGQSSTMRRVFHEIEQLTRRRVPVLVQGESGTGKELVARTLHELGPHATGPFVALNCASIPATLLESQLFGHERGAFTGATNRHVGYIEQANGGTLFLDEIAELDIELQPKLLRVLQERRVRRVGGAQDTPVDFRLVSASHRALHQEVGDGRFREDLYYRLAVFELRLPPLRERDEDILMLARVFLDRHGEGARPELDRATQSLLLGYDWPGNVRELENTMQHALVLCGGRSVQPAHLPWRLRQRHTTDHPDRPDRPDRPVTGLASAAPVTPEQLVERLGPVSLAALEQLAIDAALRRHDGHVGKAAAELGIGQTTLYRKLKARRERSDEPDA